MRLTNTPAPKYNTCGGCGNEFSGLTIRFHNSVDDDEVICPDCMDDHAAVLLGVPQGSAEAKKWRWPVGKAPSDPAEIHRACKRVVRRRWPLQSRR